MLKTITRFDNVNDIKCKSPVCRRAFSYCVVPDEPHNEVNLCDFIVALSGIFVKRNHQSGDFFMLISLLISIIYFLISEFLRKWKHNVYNKTINFNNSRTKSYWIYIIKSYCPQQIYSPYTNTSHLRSSSSKEGSHV